MRKYEDLTGKKFGDWEVICVSNKKYPGRSKYWTCICVCGKKKEVVSSHLKNGTSKCCGCKSCIKDLTNKKFGRLIVICRIGIDKDSHALWKCKCDCGNEHVVSSDCLIHAKSRSCGCLARETHTRHNYAIREKTHPLYKTWAGMKGRCTNPKEKCFRWYGGKGIKVCDEWFDHPEKFIEWAIENGWKKGLEIDRIDSNKNYSPENCQFITRRENVKRMLNAKLKR